MLVRPVQPLNAKSPMLVTLFGITILVRPEQFSNTRALIATVPSSITIDVLSGIVPLYS